MRLSISQHHLETSVNLTCRALNSFSAYDITKQLRKLMPSLEINHEDVKQCVLKYAVDNGLTVDGTGNYRVFSTTQTTPAQQVVTAVTSIVASNQSKLDKLISEKKTKTVVPQNIPVTLREVLHLQQEGKVNLTNFVRSKFPKSTSVSIRKDPNNNLIEITDGGSYSTSKEIRIRTGFKSLTVTAEVTGQKIVIKPN